MHEIDETRAASRDEAFEALIARIKNSDAKINQDETVPLYIEVGLQEFEVGTERIIEFNLNKCDFQITRKVETHILQGQGHHKHLEPLDTPRYHIILKRKLEISNDWQVIDFDEASGLLGQK